MLTDNSRHSSIDHEVERVDPLADAFRHKRGFGKIGTAQEDAEFFTAKPAQPIVLAH